MRAVTSSASTHDTGRRAVGRVLAGCLVAMLAGVGLLGCGRAGTPQRSPEAVPPGGVAGSGAPAASPSPVGLTALPDAAFLGPADLGSGFRVLKDEPLGDGYEYSIDHCIRNGQWDGTPKGPDSSSMSAKTAREVVFAGPNRALAVQWMWGLPTVEQARQQMAHTRAGFERCAEVDLGGSVYTFTAVKSDFAGDESLLVRHGERSLLLFVRAGAAYASVDLGQSFDQAQAEALADRVVRRICDATPTC